MGRVFAVTKNIRAEKGVLLVDEEQVAARWRRHLAELLHGQETMWSELAQVAREHAKTTHRKETNGFARARWAVRPGEQEPTQSDRPQWLSNLSKQAGKAVRAN